MKRERKDGAASDGGPTKRSRANATEAIVTKELAASPKETSPQNRKAGGKRLRAPVDEACPLKDTAEVFVDDDGVNYDASLSLSNIDGNKNKFYYIQLLVSMNAASYHSVWTHWGRVGENGQNKLERDLSLVAAKASFVKKFKDKTGLSWDDRTKPAKANKYTLIEKSYGEDSDDEAEINSLQLPEETRSSEMRLPICTLSEELQRLVRFLFDTGNMEKSMASQKYNYNKLPLGKLSKTTIERGYLALKELGDVILNPKLAETKHQLTLIAAFNELTSNYYTTIPHDFGRQRPTPINNETQLKVEMDLVETLANMQISNEIMKDTEFPKDAQGRAIHPLDAQMQSLGLREIAPLDKASSEFDHLKKYFTHSNESHGVTPEAIISDIYRISRSEEIDRFVSGGYDPEGMKSKVVKDHRRLLWHGSRSCNFGGILSQGLRIAPPEAPANGKAFGKGIYLADRASKSAAYCDPWTSGQTSLLLLCETQLGDPSYIKRNHEYTAAESMRKKGLISTKMLENAQNEPKKWMDAKILNPELNAALMPDHEVQLPPTRGNPNEYIVYDVAQIKIRYVFMLKWQTSRQWGIY